MLSALPRRMSGSDAILFNTFASGMDRIFLRICSINASLSEEVLRLGLLRFGRDRQRLFAQVVLERDGLDEDLGRDDGRAPIEIDAAVEFGAQGGKAQEVLVRRGTERSSVGPGMHMHDVRADGDVHRDRDVVLCGGGKHRQIGMRHLGIRDRLLDRLAEPDLTPRLRGRREKRPGLFRHAELAGRDARLRAQLFELGVVSEERIAEDGSWMLHVDLPKETAERLARLPGKEGQVARQQLLNQAYASA